MREAAVRGRSGALLGLAVLVVVVLTALRVSLPADLGSLVPGALPGQAVFVVDPTADGVVVGSAQGLQTLRPDGSVQDLGVRTRVNAVVEEPGSLLVATDRGLVRVLPAGGRPRDEALTGTVVHGLSAGADTTWAGTAAGLHRRVDGQWRRTWPSPGEPEQEVAAVLAVEGGVLFAAPGGLARQDAGTLEVRLVAPGVRVVSLIAEQGATRLWAGLFEAPLLLLSEDGGQTWQSRSQGLGFTAVNAVLPDPGVPGRLLAGGSGIADGTGNAGTQTSDDGGRTWQRQQGQLSNTHVFALAGRREALRLRLRLAGLPGSASLPLPFSSARTYAGTNGGGVYTSRPDVPVLRRLGPPAAVVRRLEPVLAGLLLLACLVPAYQRLAPAGRRTDRSNARGAPVPGAPAQNDEHEERA